MSDKNANIKNPCVKIVDSEVNITHCLKKQIAYLRPKFVQLKVITVKKMKTRYMAIVECDHTHSF